MALRVRCNLCAVNVHRFARRHHVKFETRREKVKANRKRRLGLLAPQRELYVGMAAVHDDPVTGDINRCEKRQAHDVVPVQMGHEYMVSLGHPSTKTL